MKRIENDGLVWYESEELTNLGVKHGFFTRYGGVSANEFESLNVKLGIGDEENKVLQNRELIKNTLQTKVIAFSNHLPHKSDMQWIEEPLANDPVTDALATSVSGLAIGLSVADCLPIIISDGKVAAIIHAGWRGTVARIVEKTIRILFKEHDLDLNNTVAACGPCICKDHFEVNGEAAQQLSELAGESLKGEAYNADILALNITQLKKSGINNIESLGICSYESDEFYSFRQSGGKTGRNMAIALLS